MTAITRTLRKSRQTETRCIIGRFKMNRPSLCLSAAWLCMISSNMFFALPATAQETKSEHQKKLDEIKAETELVRARAEHDQAMAERIKALGLPSFSGETKLEQGAGAMEATMLATHALQQAADQISSDVTAKPDGSPKLLLLSGEEVIDFAEAAMIETELSEIEKAFAMAGLENRTASSSGEKLFSLSAAPLVAAASALAGLIRSETTVAPVEVSALSDRVLVNAVAGRLGDRAILPAAFVGPTGNDAPLIKRLNDVAALRELASYRKAELSKQAKKNEAAIAKLASVIARFDNFMGRVSTADSKGVVPIVRAARLDAILDQKPAVLRIFVDKVGGSLINSKNIATTFGVDPVKVSGGLIASYTLTDPRSGSVWASNLLVCTTTLSRLRPIHEGNWKARTPGTAEGTKANCHKL